MVSSMPRVKWVFDLLALFSLQSVLVDVKLWRTVMYVKFKHNTNVRKVTSWLHLAVNVASLLLWIQCCF